MEGTRSDERLVLRRGDNPGLTPVAEEEQRPGRAVMKPRDVGQGFQQPPQILSSRDTVGVWPAHANHEEEMIGMGTGAVR